MRLLPILFGLIIQFGLFFDQRRAPRTGLFPARLGGLHRALRLGLGAMALIDRLLHVTALLIQFTLSDSQLFNLFGQAIQRGSVFVQRCVQFTDFPLPGQHSTVVAAPPA